MRKLTGIFALLAMVVMASGCATSVGSSVGMANTGVSSRAHTWEEPHFTADLESNPVKSELGMGFVTVGSHAGLTAHSEGKWASLNASIGPDGSE